MALANPIISWYGHQVGIGSPDLITEWNVGTVDASSDSSVWAIEIWNGRGINTSGGEEIKPMTNCYIITKTNFPQDPLYHLQNSLLAFEQPLPDLITYDNTNDPVGAKWTKVNRPGLDSPESWTALGDGDFAYLKNKEDANLVTPPDDNIIYGTDLTDETGLSEKKYAEVNIKFSIPVNGVSGQYSMYTRVEYRFE